VAVHTEQGELLRILHEGVLPAGAHDLPLDLGRYASGTYVLSLYTNLGFVTQKVIKP
jgi:hypothetical protein